MSTVRHMGFVAALLAVAVVGCRSSSGKDTQNPGTGPGGPGACGAAGEACCASSPSCEVNLTCTGGVCQSQCAATGYFREFSLPSAPDSIAPAFLTTTTRADIVVAGNELTPLYNRGATLVRAGSSPYGFTSLNKVLVQAADLDRDGEAELVASDGKIVILKLDPATATYQAKVTLTGKGAYGVLIAELDGDGDLDLVVVDQPSVPTPIRGVAVLLNNGNGTFAPKVRYATSSGVRGLTVGDLDGDGKLDLAVMKTNDVGVLKGSGTGTFGAEASYQAGTGTVGGTKLADLAIADVDGDGRGDLVVASSEPTPKVTVLKPLADGGLLWCCQATSCDPTYRNCGGDGCGGSCGTCSAPATCGADYVCKCTPDCNGKVCGPNGCGGSCGTCTTGTCDATGQCSCAGRCSSCLQSCRGISGCCCGSGCICDTVCTSACGDSC